jgi:hypothetical protein
MFKYNRSILLILFIYLSVSGLNGQKFHKGLIFSSKGDTAKGMVLLPSGYMPAHRCFFKLSANDNVVLLSGSEIEGFQTGSQTYISTRLSLDNKDTILFTRRIFKGIKELRYFEVRNVKYFIVVNPDSSLFTIKYPPVLKTSEILSGLTSEKRFIQQADSIFPDAPELPEYQKGVKPDLNSFLNLFKQYNDPAGSSSNKALRKEYKKGFVITDSRDSLNGFLLNNLEKTLYSTCIFSPGKKDSLFKLQPAEVARFGNYRKTRIFDRAKVPSAGKDAAVFARLLLEGSVDLLYYDLDGTRNYLLRDNRESIHHISYSPVISKHDLIKGLSPAGKFRIQADSILSILKIPYKDLKPEPRSMLRVLEDYHENMSQPFNYYYGISLRVALGVVAGVKFENYLFETDNDGYSSYSDPAPYLGLYLTVFNNMGWMGFLLRNTVEYHNDNYSYKQQVEEYTYFRQTTINSYADNFEAGLILWPVKHSIVKPFIEAGGAGRYYFKSSYNNYTEKNFSDQYVFSHHDHDIMNSSFFFGGFVKAGLTRAINTKNSVSLSCGYSYLVSTGSEKIHSAELSVIYNFLRK